VLVAASLFLDRNFAVHISYGGEGRPCFGSAKLSGFGIAPAHFHQGSMYHTLLANDG